MWITELCKPFLISNLMNIKQDQLNYYCYTGRQVGTCRPVLPAALLLVKTRQQQSPSMNAFTDNDSGFFLFYLFFKRPIHLMDNSGRRVTASDPSGPRTRIGPVNWRPSPWALVSTLWWWHHFWPCRGKKRKTHQQRARGKGSGERLRRAEAWAGCRKGPWITLTSPAGRQQRPLSWTTAEGPGARCFFPNLGPGGATPGVVGESQVVAYYRLLHQRHWHPCRVGPAVVIFRSHGIWSVTYWNEWKCRSEFFTLWQEINGPFPSFFKWFRLAWTVRSNHQSYSFCTVILQYMWIQ